MNRSPIADRIEDLISHKSLSIKVFSEELGVQRSSLSHILSGRNKPSLDFILKILSTYPEVNEKWLLHGKGELLKSIESSLKSAIPTESTSKSASQPDTIVTKELDTSVTSSARGNITNVPELDSALKKKAIGLKSNGLASTNKAIQQVVILYSDGSFEAFHPSQNQEE